jgi:ParB/RepB/Spo0J family partition protein
MSYIFKAVKILKEEHGMSVVEIPIKKLYVGKYNVRKDIGDITELVASIKEKGVLQPILVRPVEEKYEIIVGSRRFKAAKKAELHTIPAIVREMSDAEAVASSLVENLQRGDLGLEERVSGYRMLMELDPDRYGSYRKIAKVLGKHHEIIARDFDTFKALQRLRPLGVEVAPKVPPVAEERIEGKVIPERHAALLERTMSAINIPKEERDRKYVELARTIAPLRQEEAEKVLDEFKKYPELPAEKLKERVLAKVPIVARVPAVVARRLDEVVEKERLPQEEVIIRAIEEYIKPTEFVSERPSKMIREIDTGETWICPECSRKFRLIHCEPKGHRLEEIP